jgi:hypothetical protein
VAADPDVRVQAWGRYSIGPIASYSDVS